MNGETDSGDARFRHAFHARAEAGQGSWAKPPTQIMPGVSRILAGGFVRDPKEDVMPGASLGRGLRTAAHNPLNGIVAPMVNRGKVLPDERAPKRPRLSEPAEQPKTYQKFLNRQTLPPLVGPSIIDLPPPSTSRGAEARNGYRAHDPDDSDDPIDLFTESSRHRQGSAAVMASFPGEARPEQEDMHLYDSLDPRSQFRSKNPVHRQGTPSGTTSFQPIGPRRDRFEQEVSDPMPLSHLATGTAKVPKTRRILNMKGKDGKDRSSSKPVKSRQYSSVTVDFAGTNDPLSQPSLSPRRRPKVEREPGLDVNVGDLRKPIKGMYFEWNHHEDVTGACLVFEEQGPRLTLKFSGKEMHISNSDIRWMKTDHLTYLFLRINKEARIHRELEQSELWMPKTLDETFPSHTISLKFGQRALGDRNQHINDILDAMSGSEPPPESMASVSVAWDRLEDRRKAFSASDLTSPSPERDRLPTRSARAAPIRVSGPAKRTTRASGVKEADLDNDEVMLVFPFTGTGSVQITRGEHQRLQKDEYLNDTLIEFGLRYWLESLKETNPILATQIHVFSPFFYKKLKNKDSQTGYDAVKKWTSKVDIFQKRYLVVPINERVHWYLAIVMYPENILRSAKPIYQEIEADGPSHEDPVQQDTTEPPLMDEVVQETPQSSLPSSRAVSPQQMQVDEDTEMADALMPTTIISSSSEKAHRTAASSPGFPEEELLNIPDEEDASPPPDDSWRISQDTTWILSFDSLGQSHKAALERLHAYLTLEAKHKKGLELESSASIKSKKVPCPIQPNYCDCGVYVIKMVETFLKRPDEFFQRLMDSKSDPLTAQHPLWNPEEFKDKREALFEEIGKLSRMWMEFKGTTEAGKPPTKAASANGSKLTNPLAQNQESFFTDEGSGDEIEIVGEIPARKARFARPVQSKSRRAKRFLS